MSRIELPSYLTTALKETSNDEIRNPAIATYDNCGLGQDGSDCDVCEVCSGCMGCQYCETVTQATGSCGAGCEKYCENYFQPVECFYTECHVNCQLDECGICELDECSNCQYYLCAGYYCEGIEFTFCPHPCQHIYECGYCQNSCTNFCEMCEYECEGCEGDCQDCQVGCLITSQGCLATCEKNCQSTCESACQAACELGCQDCQTACQLACQDCQTTCQLACQDCQSICEITSQHTHQYKTIYEQIAGNNTHHRRYQKCEGCNSIINDIKDPHNFNAPDFYHEGYAVKDCALCGYRMRLHVVEDFEWDYAKGSDTSDVFITAKEWNKFLALLSYKLASARQDATIKALQVNALESLITAEKFNGVIDKLHLIKAPNVPSKVSLHTLVLPTSHLNAIRDSLNAVRAFR